MRMRFIRFHLIGQRNVRIQSEGFGSRTQVLRVLLNAT